MADLKFNLTKKYLQSIFDYKDGHLYWKKRLARCIQIGDKAGNLKNDGYILVVIAKKSYPIHRVIYALHNGCFDGCIDHIDGNRSNNKIENLRLASYTENQYNRKINKNNTSGCKGVNWDKIKQKWVASIKVNKKRVHLGEFVDKQYAIKAIELGRFQYHKEFTRHK